MVFCTGPTTEEIQIKLELRSLTKDEGVILPLVWCLKGSSLLCQSFIMLCLTLLLIHLAVSMSIAYLFAYWIAYWITNQEESDAIKTNLHKVLWSYKPLPEFNDRGRQTSLKNHRSTKISWRISTVSSLKMSGHAGSFTNAALLYASFKINFLVAVSCSERQTDPNFLLMILNLSFWFSILLLNVMRNVDPAVSACYSQGSQMEYFEPCMRHTLDISNKFE